MNGKKAKMIRRLAAKYKKLGFDFDYRIDALRSDSAKVLKRVYLYTQKDLRHKFEQLLE